MEITRKMFNYKFCDFTIPYKCVVQTSTKRLCHPPHNHIHGKEPTKLIHMGRKHYSVEELCVSEFLFYLATIFFIHVYIDLAGYMKQMMDPK